MSQSENQSTSASSVSLPSPESAREMLTGAIEQIRFARHYTLELLEATPHDQWLTIPAGLPTNIAWQVGHLTVSQYGLLMFRIRGRQSEDLDLIPGRFRKAYGRGSTPKSDPEGQPSAEALLERLGRVYESGLHVLESVSPDVLLEPIDMPYAAYPIKLGAILFCPLHEHIHAGQIGLVRRALGLDPVR
ncbi:DinB family protein [Stieleria sp. ICT_E10.1]|uniref:DinB family protein n=1 Tax=Stieleria sedimenti TaxID=2976331 RepID=UPI00217F8D5A|nr:DinB family protein [Stieleria sedimenti]MCS7467569.1 DinB family protein [Stieleria sedimenti]